MDKGGHGCIIHGGGHALILCPRRPIGQPLLCVDDKQLYGRMQLS